MPADLISNIEQMNITEKLPPPKGGAAKIAYLNAVIRRFNAGEAMDEEDMKPLENKTSYQMQHQIWEIIGAGLRVFGFWVENRTFVAICYEEKSLLRKNDAYIPHMKKVDDWVSAHNITPFNGANPYVKT